MDRCARSANRTCAMMKLSSTILSPIRKAALQAWRIFDFSAVSVIGRKAIP
jgi:hypothetical protein